MNLRPLERGDAMESRTTIGWVFAMQLASVTMIWMFVLGISFWIIHLLRLSRELNDIPSGSLAISMLAIPVFLLGASVLTYVFVGLRRGRDPLGGSEGDVEET
ncbi:MAG: hypothetical protein E4G90_05505 [Gemmatimonadales bacterium]|nr:MAG: hypothetical protein E4G90_05505 [Gemmatimonadales bacterium]